MKRPTLSMRRIYQFLILFVILLTPVFNVMEVMALMGRTLSSYGQALTPAYIKGIKDAVFILIMLIGLAGMAVKRRPFLKNSYIFFIVLVTLSAAVSLLASGERMMFLFGIRWILPLLLLFFIYDSVDAPFQRKLARLMTFLFLIAFVLQLYEFYNVSVLYGVTAIGTRVPGFYVIPSSMAMFTMLTMYYLYHFGRRCVFRNLLLFFACPLSVFLTGSGSGLLVLFLFYAIMLYARIKQRNIIMVLSVILILIAASFLPSITHRPLIYESMFSRLDIFLSNINQDNIFVSSEFGKATNVAGLAKTDVSRSNGSRIVDSTITSLIFNTGLLSLFFFVFFLSRFLKNEMIYYHFWCIYLIFMVTTIIFEMFPANLLLTVNLAYFYAQRSNTVDVESGKHQ